MDDRINKVAGAVAISASVAGIGAVATFICAKHLRAMRKENQRVSQEIQTLSGEVRALRAEIAGLKGTGNGDVPRTLSKSRSRVRLSVEGSGDAPSISFLSSQQSGRVMSYQSLTSDAEYDDAEEEWGSDDGGGQQANAKAVLLPPMSFADVDQIYGRENVRPGYDILKKRYDGGDKSSELLWRLAKFCHEMACRTTDKSKKKELVLEGKAFALEGYHLKEEDFNALKWAAIMTGSSTDYLGTKEKIEEGGKFKQLLDKALAMDAKEFSLLHMRGRYSFSVASLSWIERKAAAVFYATPPTATMEEALEDFLAAYEEKPDWIENLIYIARIFFAKGDKESTKKFCNHLITLTPTDADERERIQEAKKMLAKC